VFAWACTEIRVPMMANTIKKVERNDWGRMDFLPVVSLSA
jgi:hypothetical protein